MVRLFRFASISYDVITSHDEMRKGDTGNLWKSHKRNCAQCIKASYDLIDLIWPRAIHTTPCNARLNCVHRSPA